MKKLHFFADPFVLQSLISAIPAVLVNGFIPIFGSYLGLSLVQIGVLFMSMRGSLVLGSQIAPWLLGKQKPHAICTVLELLNSVIAFLMCVSIWGHSAFAFFMLGCLRTFNSGIITTTRFYWLKQLVRSDDANKINLFISSSYQVSYGLVGVAIVINPSIEIGIAVLVFDAVTSVIGGSLFYRLKNLFVDKLTSVNRKVFKFKTLVSTSLRRKVTVLELFVVLAMGGSNIILVKYGEMFWGTHGGYGTSLVIYGFFYLLGSLVFRKLFLNKDNKFLYFVFCLIMATSFVFISLNQNVFVNILAFTVIFLTYPVISLKIEKWWFALSSKSDAAEIGSSRSFLSQSAFALGEWAYAILLFDALIRAGLLFIASMLIGLLPRKVLEINREV